MLEKARKNVEVFTTQIAKSLNKGKISPSHLTVLGLIFAVASALAFSSLVGNILLAGILFLVSAVFDLFDGPLARVSGKESDKGAFLDSTLDRLGESLIILAIIEGGHADPLLAGSVLMFSLLVSYTRAKGEALNMKISGLGIGERAERVLALSILSIIGYVEIGLVIVAFLAAVTFVQRFVFIYRAASKKV